MDEWSRKIGGMKTLIDAGMCRVGPRLEAASPEDGALVHGAGRALALSDAALALCRAGRPNEALPLLRELAGMGASMRWITTQDRSLRAKTVFAEREGSGWDRLWSDERLISRAREAGCLDDARVILGLCSAFIEGAESTLPWAHVFARTRRSAPAVEQVLGLVACWMGHVISALDARWPGDFPQG
ncbi:MAG: hypothetical protein WCU88_07025 [Elusimicrobiota bacterium]|jgi:hypothetical protein